MKQYLEQHSVRGRTLVQGCGYGHEVALAVAHGLDVTGLDIAPTAVAAARALYPQLADRTSLFAHRRDVAAGRACLLCPSPPSARVIPKTTAIPAQN